MPVPIVGGIATAISVGFNAVSSGVSSVFRMFSSIGRTSVPIVSTVSKTIGKQAKNVARPSTSTYQPVGSPGGKTETGGFKRSFASATAMSLASSLLGLAPNTGTSVKVVVFGTPDSKIIDLVQEADKIIVNRINLFKQLATKLYGIENTKLKWSVSAKAASYNIDYGRKVVTCYQEIQIPPFLGLLGKAIQIIKEAPNLEEGIAGIVDLIPPTTTLAAALQEFDGNKDGTSIDSKGAINKFSSNANPPGEIKKLLSTLLRHGADDI